MECTMTRTATVKKSPNGTTVTRRPAFDLASRYVKDTVEMVLYDPVDLSAKIDTGIRIGIRSVYSREARAAAQAVRAKIKLVDDKVISTDTEVDELFFEQTIGATAYWKADDDEYHDTLLIEGEKLACTPENVRALYTNPATAWIQRQVQAVYLNIAGFFEPPKTA
jgi:hypothetical protein